jgi:peptidyl-prolyl cis-trans isomerase SurA
MTAERRYGGRAVRAAQWITGVVAAAMLLTARPPARPPALSAQEPTPAPAAAAAQQPTGPQLIDRIVAIVGDRAILLSEVDEKINEARQQGLQVPQDSAQVEALRRQMLSNAIDEELVYQQARHDTSISVTDAEVQAAVDEQARSVRNQFHSDAEYRTALQGAGLTPEEYRRRLTDEQRRTAFVQRYVAHQRQEGKLRPGTVSETEMRAFFNEMKTAGRIGRLPPSITFRQVVISPRPSTAERAAAFARADSVRLAIERGADFSEMARRFSDDPTTKANGGDLGWFRRGQMVRQFEEAAFALRPNVPSPVVQTEYGYHIIMVDRVQTGQVKARHILFAPAVSDSERATARRIADSVAVLLGAGVSADTLAKLYSDSGEAVSVGPADRSQLPAGYSQALATAAVGQVIGPTPLNPEAPERPRYLVAKITDVQPEREPTFEDKREEVRSALLDQRGLAHLLEDLRKRTYVSVRL